MGMGDQECPKCGWETYGAECRSCAKVALEAKLKIAVEALDDAIEKIESEYCSHPAPTIPPHPKCWAAEQYNALIAIRKTGV
jgi:hypothetical protein